MHLTFRIKLMTVAGVGALAFALLVVTNALLSTRVEQQMARIQQHYIPLAELEPVLEAQLERISRGFQDAVAARDLDALVATRELESRFFDELAAARGALDADDAAALRRATELYCAAAEDVSRRLIAEESGELLVDAIADMQAKQAEVKRTLRVATAFDRHELAAAFASAADAMRTAHAYRLLISVGFVAIVGLLAFVTSRSLLRSLAELKTGLARFGRGRFEERIVMTSHDELEDVAEGANRMARSLAQAQNELRAAHNELEAKVEQRTVQLVEANDELLRAQSALRESNEGLERRVEERTAQVQIANRELEAFSYAVAHDLRAPLRGVSGFAEVLLADYEAKLDADGKDCLQEICDNARRMGELIDALLALARVTRAELKTTRVDLTALVRAVADEIAAAQPREKSEVVVAESAEADMDPRLARALFENLLGNAWKFTSKVPAPQIEFGVTDTDGVREFFVRDNGAGFDAAYAGKLFAPFQRLHTTAEFPGTGIGLATVQRIVHRHGGRIWAEGRVGAGATFHFTIPNRSQEVTA